MLVGMGISQWNARADTGTLAALIRKALTFSVVISRIVDAFLEWESCFFL